MTLVSGKICNVPLPHDPADDQSDEADEKGITTKTARQKVIYVDTKTFDQKIAEYVKMEKM